MRYILIIDDKGCIERIPFETKEDRELFIDAMNSISHTFKLTRDEENEQ